LAAGTRQDFISRKKALCLQPYHRGCIRRSSKGAGRTPDFGRQTPDFSPRTSDVSRGAPEQNLSPPPVSDLLRANDFTDRPENRSLRWGFAGVRGRTSDACSTALPGIRIRR
jgi:hypothetical protein